MNGWIEIYRICWKQYFIKFRIWIVVFSTGMLALGIFRSGNPEQEEYSGITVGVYAEDEKGRVLLDKLEREKGIFRFQGYTEEEQMIRQIENGTLECGYVLPEGFYENLLRGRTVRQITLYCSPASSAHKISYEVVFADLFEILSEDILKSYLQESEFFEKEEIERTQERLLELNAQYAKDGSTFRFVYETTKEKEDAEPENLNTVRGIISVIIFFVSLLGLGNCMDQKMVCGALPGKNGKRFRSGCIHVAVLGSVLLGGLCIFLSGAGGSFMKEAGGLLLYFLVLEIYIRILNFFIKSSRALYGMLPVMVSGCCLFCPVFIRIGRYLPGADWISGLFPAAYYLNFFSS